MRILFTGGGSGGHIFPITAVKREIDALVPEEEVNTLLFQFLGGQPPEKDILSKERIYFKKIIATKWRRYFSFKNFIDILKTPFSLLQAIFYVWLFMPDIIFSKGGPGSLPVVLVSWLYQIPIIIHESDSIPGSTNKLSSPFARKIAISFKESEQFFSKRQKKLVLTGNPIRQTLFSGSRERAINNFNLTGKRKIILIMGGSQGADQINSIFIDAIYKYIEKYEIIHICGPKNFKETNILTRGILKKEQRRFYHLYPYLDEEKLSDAYKIADLVISRAGAGTIFEIAALEKPSVIIPLEGGAQNHQAKNAQYFANSGAATVIEETNITPNFVFGRASQIIETEKTIQQMKEGCKSFAKPEAAKKVAEIILNNV
jgi:UDP-N-acetylglucosamine--N-acetylmuramyl-(pentapeptide) pyrophosphoryl-undecaprenol N-acetylglucosamine transferase